MRQSQTKTVRIGRAAARPTFNRERVVRATAGGGAGSATSTAADPGHVWGPGLAERRRCDLAADDPAVDAGLDTRVEDEVEPCARRVGDRDEDEVRPRLGDDLRHLLGCAQYRHADQAPAPEPRVVVDEADDLLAWRLAQFPRE